MTLLTPAELTEIESRAREQIADTETAALLRGRLEAAQRDLLALVDDVRRLRAEVARMRPPESPSSRTQTLTAEELEDIRTGAPTDEKR